MLDVHATPRIGLLLPLQLDSSVHRPPPYTKARLGIPNQLMPFPGSNTAQDATGESMAGVYLLD